MMGERCLDGWFLFWGDLGWMIFLEALEKDDIHVQIGVIIGKVSC